MNRIIYVFVLVFLSGCAPYPNVPYYEIDEAIADAETEEEADYYRGRAAAIEEKAEKAGIFLEAWGACTRSTDCRIQCVWNGGPVRKWREKDMINMDIPTLIRWYNDHRPPTCGFIQGSW